MSTRNLLELIGLAALWGASFLFMRIATPEFGAIALIEIRVLIAALFLLPIWLKRESARQLQNTIEHAWPILILGIVNSAVPFVLFAYSTLYITGGFSSILNATVPIWGAIVAWLWLKRKPSFDGVIGLVLGIVGVTVLVSKSVSFSLGNVSLGIFAALGAAVLYGIAANYAAEKLASLSPLTIATFSQVAATVALFPLAIIYFPTEPVSLKSWLAVIALGVFCTGMANVLYFKLIANIGSTKAITVTFLIPVFATLWGAMFINEQISLEMVVGTLIILSGTALVTGVVSIQRKRYIK